MKGRYVLALDQGTTNSKALLFDGDGNIVSRASRSLRTASSRGGFVEQDAGEIWSSIAEAARECLGTCAGADVSAIGISNQRETVVLWEASTGKPVAPAVVWQCRRSTELCEALRQQGLEPILREKTGLGIDPLFSASKIAWLLDKVPGARERAERGELRCGTVDSWLIWQLTGGRKHVCDLSNASRTQLLNLRTLEWDDELLALFRIPRALLPALVDSSGVLGESSSTSFPAGIPIASAVGDSHAALAGHAISAPGAVKATYGTGSSLMMLSSGLPAGSSELSSTIAWSRSGKVQYALEGNIAMTGSAVEWCGNFLGLSDPVQGAASLAASVDSSEGVFFVPAMCGLGAPYWNGTARGTIVGLERASTAAHLAQAAMDSIAFQVRDVCEAMERVSGRWVEALYADGGAARNDSLMQLQADILGRPVLRSSTVELSAVGAAYLAGAAVGLWKSPSEVAALHSAPDRFEPMMDAAIREERYRGWKQAVTLTLDHARRLTGQRL